MAIMNLSPKNTISLDDICYLFDTKIITDKSGIEHEKHIDKKMAFCAQIPAYRVNSFTASTENLKYNVCLLLVSEEYSGEKFVEYGGKIFPVDRFFPRDDGFTEIYLIEKIGVTK